MTQITYTPPAGDPVAFLTGNDAVYRLLALDGIGPLAVSPISRKSPGQIGETAVDVTVPSRVVIVQLILQAASRDALWPVRAALARALVQEPVSSDSVDPYALGRLRVSDRPASPDVELLCLPRSSTLPMPKSNVGILPADVEFYAPQPWWQSLYDSQLVFGSGANGLQWPVQFPIQFLTNNVEQEAVNEGDVKAPITARIFGDLVNPKLTNEETGEAVEITGSIAAGDRVEIVTEFGAKTVTYVTSGGVRTNWMDHLNLSIADFWQLLPGSNTVKFEASVNTSGTALLLWRSRYSGI